MAGWRAINIVVFCYVLEPKKLVQEPGRKQRKKVRKEVTEETMKSPNNK